MREIYILSSLLFLIEVVSINFNKLDKNTHSLISSNKNQVTISNLLTLFVFIPLSHTLEVENISVLAPTHSQIKLKS